MNSSEVKLKSDSEKFITALLDLTAGFIPPDDFNKLIELINSEIGLHFFTASSENNLLRIFSCRFDKGLFFSECIKYPHYIEIITSIASNSNYLSQILEINPEYFYLISDPSRINEKLDKTEFQKEVSATLKKYQTTAAKVRALKSIKRKEILRIGLRDIFLKADLEEVTSQLSALANTIASELFKICYEESATKNKIRFNEKDFVIVSLGKLGGNELNYSSDIDLIIFFEKDKKFPNGKFFKEILIEAARFFISEMSASVDGFLYRVDLRLRPDGRTSPLCGSLSEYLSYYERRGEDWERQMLIKAEFVTGNKKLYNKFINYLKPFIYPSGKRTSPIEEIRRLKDSSEKLLGEKNDIKIQPGGIRDIEFAVQALQLIHGGKLPELQTGNTINAINNLSKFKLITVSEFDTLHSSYIFYRKIEHYLQLMNNSQTHLIPKVNELEEKISYFLGFKNVREFRKDLTVRRNEVRKFYNSVIGTEKNKINVNSGFDKINFADKKRAASNFEYLSEGKGILGKKIFDTTTRKRFGIIEAQLLRFLSNAALPDKTLDNFVRVIRFAEFPSIWYKEFEEKTFFDLFLRVCEYSQRAVDLFAEDKSLRDFFLSRDVFKKISDDNLNETHFKKLIFILSIQTVTGLLDPLKVCSILSHWVQNKIKIITEDFVKNYNWKNEYFIAIMGSCGSSEMTFGSDVDLIFVINNIKKYPHSEKNFVSLLQIIREHLSPLQTDCRLRPEGKSSQLLWDIETYKKYLQERARTWELQAMLKIKFISGNKKLFDSLRNGIIKTFTNKNQVKIKSDFKEMRRELIPSETLNQINLFDLRKSRGGITDMEYSVHFLLVQNKLVQKNIFGVPLNKIIAKVIGNKKLRLAGLISADNFEFLKRLEILH